MTKVVKAHPTPDVLCHGGHMELTVTDVAATSTPDTSIAVVSVTGEVDIYTADTLDERLMDLINSGRTRVVMDLTGVGFLDSTGLGVVVKTLKRVRELGGTLGLVVADDRILKVFRITGLDRAVELHPSVPEAVAAA